jgi:isopenicillin-N epimerase
MLAGDEPSDLHGKFLLDPNVVYLNHGAFGACPIEVLEHQSEIRGRMERNAMQFFLRDLDGLYDETRAAVAPVFGAKPEDLAFVTNATSAVNAIVRSMDLAPGDELLTTDHAYNACQNALHFVAERTGAKVVVAAVPFPLTDPEEVVAAIAGAVTPRTKLALVDHVTSQTALVFPIARIVRALADRGVETLVDGAHAPGMVEVDVEAIGAAYYTANCHKWLCAPKGAAVLHVRKDKQATVRPLTISHGANRPSGARSRFDVEFDWQGTHDPSAIFSIPRAIAFLEGSMPGGLAAVRARNHALALRARAALLALTGGAAPAPESMIGSIASVEIPSDGRAAPSSLDLEPLTDELARRYRIEIPVFGWSRPAKRLLRVSAHVYNRWREYDALLAALRDLLGRPA